MREPTIVKSKNKSSFLARNAVAIVFLLLLGNVIQYLLYHQVHKQHLSEISIYDQYVEKTKQDLILADELIEKQENQLKLYEKALQTDKSDQDELSENLRLSEARLQTKIDQVNKIQSQIEARDKLLSELQNELTKAHAESTQDHESLSKQLLGKDEKIEALNVRVNTLNEAKSTIEQKFKQQEEQMHELKTELQFLRGEVKKNHKYRFADDKEYRERTMYAADVERKQKKLDAYEEQLKDKEKQEKINELRAKRQERLDRESAARRANRTRAEQAKADMEQKLDDDTDDEDNSFHFAAPLGDAEAPLRVVSTPSAAPPTAPAFADPFEARPRDVSDDMPVEIAELFDELNEQQFPSTGCENKRAIIFSFDSFKRYGFATALHHVSLALLYARDTDRVLVLRQPDTWIYASPTCQKGFACYFNEPSGCSEAEILKNARRPSMALHDANVDDRVVLYSSSGATYGVVSRQGAAYRTLWWRAHVMRWLLQPHPEFLQNIASFRKANGWIDDVAVIGVHVRHGDKKTEVAMLHDTREYIDAALRMRAKQPSLKVLFLSSDDPAVIEQAKVESVQNGFRLIYRKEKRTNDAVHALLTKGQIDAMDQGTTALENIWLLSLCDELIGTFSSSFFKLAYELRYARTGKQEAHSLDLSAWRA